MNPYKFTQQGCLKSLQFAGSEKQIKINKMRYFLTRYIKIVKMQYKLFNLSINLIFFVLRDENVSL